MKLVNPVTLDLPQRGTRTFAELPVTIIDNVQLKRVQVQLRPFMKLLTLWEGEVYTQAGDYTQAQVETRIFELLGDDPAAVLLELYVAPPVRS